MTKRGQGKIRRARYIGVARRGHGAELEEWNIRPLDALHLASAESARADFFLTTDDNLLRRASRHQAALSVKIENPAKWLIQQATYEN